MAPCLAVAYRQRLTELKLDPGPGAAPLPTTTLSGAFIHPVCLWDAMYAELDGEGPIPLGACNPGSAHIPLDHPPVDFPLPRVNLGGGGSQTVELLTRKGGGLITSAATCSTASSGIIPMGGGLPW